MAEENRFEHTLGDADTLMWNIERDPQLRSTIVTVLVLDRAPAWSGVLARIERGTRLIPRLRQRVVEPAAADRAARVVGGSRLRPHVPRPARAGPEAAIVRRGARRRATAAMGDFDRARPLWEYTLVEGLPTTERPSC